MGRKTKDEAAKTKCAILKAAIDVFIEKGVSRTSLQDIALAANVTRGAVYHHFENKFAILLELIKSAHSPVQAIWAELETEKLEDPLGALRNCLIRSFEVILKCDASRKIHMLLFHRCEFTEEMVEILEWEREDTKEFLRTMTSFIEQAVIKNQIRKDIDPEKVVRGIYGLTIGLYKCHLEYDWMDTFFDTFEFSIDRFIDGMRPNS